MTYTRLAECLRRSLNVSSAMPDLSSSPRPSAIMRSYCSLVARERQIETEIERQLENDPAVFGCMRGGEKAATLAVLHVFAVGSSTREDDVEVNGISCGKIIKIEVPDFRLVMPG